LRWLKTESFWGDSARWIFEAWRSASGETPYRDFAWQYPPLSLLLFGSSFRIFGATFVVAQVLIDIVSTVVVLLSWRVARRVLPTGLALAVAAALACAGASNTGNFALFSLQIYTPAVLVGMAGLLLVLEQLIVHIEAGSLGLRSRMLLSVGATIALLSKPEFAIGVVGALAAAAFFELQRSSVQHQSTFPWLRRQASTATLTMVPALALYALLAWKAGAGNVLSGVTGYGMAYLVCPWWPTGLGVFGAVVALLQAAAVLAVGQWLYSRRQKPYPSQMRSALIIAAALAVPATLVYVPYCIKELPVFAGAVTPIRLISFFLSTGTILLPVMWCSILFWVALSLGVARRRTLSSREGVLFILSTCGLVMSSRTLFGGTLSQLTLVTVAAYPIWFIMAPLLLERFLDGGDQPSPGRAPALAMMLVAAYGVLRFSTALVTEPSSHYVVVHTAAGNVRLLDRTTSASVYRYVIDHTSSADPVLDITYGGAINFAGRRLSPIYSTQFSALAPAQKYLDLDLDRIRAHPPALVIANALPDFGATYGMCVETGCMLPALVWRSSRLACEPGRKFPVLEFIKENYSRREIIGEKTIYTPNLALAAAIRNRR
jgi:hypothetical protein